MSKTALIGFGEAGRAFVGAPGWRGAASAFDVKLLDFTTRGEIANAAAALRVTVTADVAAAVADASLTLSLVTADQSLAAAQAVAPHLARGTIYCDMNSVAPATKRRAAAAIEYAGAIYADVAVMAPVQPLCLATPLLVAGPQAERAAAALRARGFANVRTLGGQIGAAAAIKMIRSVMVKGVEALTAECLLAAEAAGVRAEVLASLDESERAMPWTARADYLIGRMMTHGLRRADEMEQAVATLDALAVDAAMSRGTVVRQRAAGALRVAPPAGLDAKLAALGAAPRDRRQAA